MNLKKKQKVTGNTVTHWRRTNIH